MITIRYESTAAEIEEQMINNTDKCSVEFIKDVVQLFLEKKLIEQWGYKLDVEQQIYEKTE